MRSDARKARAEANNPHAACIPGQCRAGQAWVTVGCAGGGGDVEALVATLTAIIVSHQRIPLYDNSMGQRCVGCDNLHSESDGPNSPRHAEHVAREIAATLTATTPGDPQ